MAGSPSGNSQRRPGARNVTGLDKNRRDLTVVHLRFDTAGSRTRYASDLYWRKPELKDKDNGNQRIKEHVYEKG